MNKRIARKIALEYSRDLCNRRGYTKHQLAIACRIYFLKWKSKTITRVNFQHYDDNTLKGGYE